MSKYSIFDPDLLCESAAKQSVRVFLCGPGADSGGFDDREFIKKNLSIYRDTSVTYGEEIEERGRFRRRGQDLQTLEAEFAHSVDFTVLMLNSPGSIAELGTFSMIPNIRTRLFVVVSNRFYGSSSYIARGPLSLVASSQLNNVIYYDEGDREGLLAKLMLPMSLYKFARFVDSEYLLNAILGFKRRDFGHNEYETLMRPIRERYFRMVVLASIVALGRPTFAELTAYLKISPDLINNSLAGLHQRNCISKRANGVYSAVAGYEDPLLSAFSSTELSKLRTRLLAA